LLVDPSLPLGMRPRSRMVWNALLQHDRPVRRREVDAALPFEFGDKHKKDNVLTSLRTFARQGYVAVSGVGKSTAYRALLPLQHPPVACSTCGSVIPVDKLLLRASRSSIRSEPGATNQYRSICRPCRTMHTVRCRGRDRATYVWSKVKTRQHGRKDGDLTKEHLETMCVDACPVLGVPLTYANDCSPAQASPDRIDSSVGYTVDNTRIVCLLVNYARHKFDVDDDEIKRIFASARSGLQTARSTERSA
jgi:hypothetical protein